MQVIRIGGVSNPNEIAELVRMFLPPGAFELDLGGAPIAASADEIKRAVYLTLVEETGRRLAWGILTGVKPLKLYAKLIAELGGQESADKKLRDFYLVEQRKIDMLRAAWSVQKKTLAPPAKGAVGIYIGIPFCPSRCAYCSFTSNAADAGEIARYLEALKREMAFVGEHMADSGMFAESIYIGGGTPTAISVEEMRSLLADVTGLLPKKSPEITVEAGRPDTITQEMAFAIKEGNASRISINPQTTKQETLDLIGRKHDVDSVYRAFELARKADIGIINADLIAGLPGEDVRDFSVTVSEILTLKPENITVHTLSVKKGSRVREESAELCYNDRGIVAAMIDGIPELLRSKGYFPYYLYRQKQMLDNLENVGYATAGAECVYNMRIMEEKQTIIAMGAGGSSKVYFEDEDRIERVFNVSNYQQYIDRIEEMLERKTNGLFAKQTPV